MVTVKMLKPYYVKTEEKYIRIILAYQYFSIIMNKKVYQFIPVKSTEVRINRKTKKLRMSMMSLLFKKGKKYSLSPCHN